MTGKRTQDPPVLLPPAGAELNKASARPVAGMPAATTAQAEQARKKQRTSQSMFVMVVVVSFNDFVDGGRILYWLE